MDKIIAANRESGRMLERFVPDYPLVNKRLGHFLASLSVFLLASLLVFWLSGSECLFSGIQCSKQSIPGLGDTHFLSNASPRDVRWYLVMFNFQYALPTGLFSGMLFSMFSGQKRM